ncbi:MAG: hypothetical protein HZA02_09060 [Nitrospinae bacterium]|nr:hypothetical protein [Nitrospinota bacterium]
MKIKCNKTVLVVLFLLFGALPAIAGELSKPTRAEVIDEVSRFTGLAADAVGLVYEEHAALFENVNHAVFAVKAVNMIADARDQELAAEIAMEGLDYGLGKIKDKFLPGAVNGFLTMAGVYQTSLEILRDYVVIPKFEESIYQAYKASRSGDSKMDVHPESRETAFAAGVMNSASGYYYVKDKMFEEMIKKKNWTRESVSERWRTQIDDFWIKRLESRYQLEALKAQKEKLKAEAWKIVARDLDAIRAEAAKPRPRKEQVNIPAAGNVPGDNKGGKNLTGSSTSKDKDAVVCASLVKALEANVNKYVSPGCVNRLELIVPYSYQNGDCVGAHKIWNRCPQQDNIERAINEWASKENPGRVSIGAVRQQYEKEFPNLPWR